MNRFFETRFKRRKERRNSLAILKLIKCLKNLNLSSLYILIGIEESLEFLRGDSSRSATLVVNHNVESTCSTSRGRFSHWLQTVTYYTSHVRISRRTTYSKGIQRVIRRELRTSLVRIDAIKRNGSNYESMLGTLGIFLFFVGRVQHWQSIRKTGNNVT